MLEFVREDDFVEYFLFIQLTNDNHNVDKTNNDLSNILKQVNQSHTHDYIWHKDKFYLTARTDIHQTLIEENNEKKELLPPHLYGISHYGDNIQDEWFIVYLLYEITRKIPGIIARVIDSDGEFLLIEAADNLPKWANPESCEQRVYIHDGHLHLVQNSPSNTKTILPISTGISKIWSNPTLYRVSDDIQNCINERLEEINHTKQDLVHNQIIRVPFAVAAILKEDPSLIAAATRAFCERDVIDMKACRAMRYFPPENRVRTSVKFTKCLYAMITHNNYVPDRRIGWELPKYDTKEYKEDLLGIKIACGFEILATQFKSDSNDDIENEGAWKVYLKSLIQRGYFKENIEGSKDYTKLYDDAKEFYRENKNRFQTAPVIGEQILKLLSNLDVNTADQLKLLENSLKPSDNDDWLNISSEDLDTMLTKKYGIKKLYQANGNVDSKEFTNNIVDFLEKSSGIDGVEIEPSEEVQMSPTPNKKSVKKNNSLRKACSENPVNADCSTTNKNCAGTSSNDPNQINFDPDSFSTHIKNFLDFVIPEDNWESNSEMSDYEDDNDLEKNIEDMTNDNTKVNLETYFNEYTQQMDKELSKTAIGKTFGSSKKYDTDEDDFDDIESFKPINIDVNALKNMMDSYKSQIGGSGPASTLLSAMGIGVSTDNKDNDKKKDDLSETQV